jgi:hypothetical protein
MTCMLQQMLWQWRLCVCHHAVTFTHTCSCTLSYIFVCFNLLGIGYACTCFYMLYF